MSAAPGDSPSRIGRFEIRGEIGRGTMGVVYEALDPVLGRTVALKTIALAGVGAPAERASFEQRFLAEARIAARLSHPGIVVIHDVGRDAATGTLYMALEHLSGRTLEEIVAEGRPVPWQEVLRILVPVAAALHHAHGQGVVHRDVKPANVMLLASGAPKIMDFGIAKLLVEGNATTTEHLLGTPLYMAPEQARGEAVDARSDIFSLGTIAYSLLTGKRAFQARSIPSILARVLHHDPPPPSGHVPGLPAPVDDLILRAMTKAPAGRYPTAKAMSEDAEDILAGRTPRHRGEWIPAPVGDQTLVSAAPEAGDELPELEALDPTPAARRRPPDPRPRFLAMVLLGGGIGIAAAGLLRFQLSDEPAPVPSQPAAMPSRAGATAETAPRVAPEDSDLPPASPVPDTEATPTAPTSLEESPSPEPGPPDNPGVEVAALPSPLPAPPAPTPSPEPTAAVEEPALAAPVPSPSPAVRNKEAEKRAPDPKEKPRLAVYLDAALAARSLRVWVDGKLLVDEKLDPAAARKSSRPEAPAKAFSLSPGRRQLRLQVRTDEGLRGERLIVTFKAGTSRRLDVKAGRGASALAFVLR
jgi:serine/threonine protein kinase